MWDDMIMIEPLESGDKETLTLLKRPELGVTLSKLRAWSLVQFDKCVFLDADTLGTVICLYDDFSPLEPLPLLHFVFAGHIRYFGNIVQRYTPQNFKVDFNENSGTRF